MILIVGLTDYVIRNLLRSSFAARARELGLRLHGMVYPDIFPAYREMLYKELAMTSEPQDLVGLTDPHLGRLAFRANLYQRGRVNSRTFRAKRRNSFAEQKHPFSVKLKFEAALLFGRLGGKLGWENGLEEEYFNGLAEYAYVRDVCLPYLLRMRPTVVVGASADGFPDTPWLIAAGLMGVPRAVWIRSWDNITTKCELIPDAELFLVWSDLMERELRHYFPRYDHRRVLKIGTPQFDGHQNPKNIIPRKEFCERMGLDPNRPIVLYCTGGTHICQNEHLIIKHVHQAVQELKDVRNPQLLVRLHPYFWDTNIDLYEEIQTNLAFWPKREDATKRFNRSGAGLLEDYQIMLSSFYHQAVNVNIASTVTLDSAIYDRPIICIAYDGPQKLSRSLSVRRFYLDYEHFIQVINAQAVDVVWNHGELKNSLRQALLDPRRRSSERRRLIETECGVVDGKAGQRLAEVLSHMVRHKTVQNDASAFLQAAG
jgi:hypothetical protein